MVDLTKTIQVYETLSKNKYQIIIEDGTVINLRFKKENYHHLAGFQHLTDFRDISNPRQGKKRFFDDVKEQRIKTEKVQRSAKYSIIENRLRYFDRIGQIMVPGQQKIIVCFDDSLLRTKIEAVYFLYKKEGQPYSDGYLVCMLFLGYDKSSGTYFPTTYVVEDSNRYLSGQEYLMCDIHIRTPKKRNEK